MKNIFRLQFINGDSLFFEDIDTALKYIEAGGFGAATSPSIHEATLYEKCDILTRQVTEGGKQ